VKRALFSALTSLLVVAIAAAASSTARSGKESEKERVANTAPIGMESLLPRPHGQAFAIYASVEGADLLRPQALAMPQSSDASAPEASQPGSAGRLSFRVTATTLGVQPDAASSARFDSDLETAELLRSLHFRLRISQGGLKVERLQPADVRMIGVPADVPYGERIYRVIFQSAPLPASTRMVLEVTAPNGELLCKFPVAGN